VESEAAGRAGIPMGQIAVGGDICDDVGSERGCLRRVWSGI